MRSIYHRESDIICPIGQISFSARNGKVSDSSLIGTRRMPATRASFFADEYLIKQQRADDSAQRRKRGEKRAFHAENRPQRAQALRRDEEIAHRDGGHEHGGDGGDEMVPSAAPQIHGNPEHRGGNMEL